MRGLLIVSLATMAFSGGSAMAQSAAAGEKVFAQCKLCHQVGDKAKNGIGPQLNGLIGRTPGSVPGFNYSAAVKSAGGVWDESRFKAFIADPKAMFPDTKMPFEGLQNETEVNDLTAFLKTWDAAGKRSP